LAVSEEKLKEIVDIILVEAGKKKDDIFNFF
jgi:hypothetical protein